MDFETDIDGQSGQIEQDAGAPAGLNDADEAKTPEQQKRLAQQLCRTIKEDKKHHEKAFKRMRRDMQVAMWGADKTWGEDRYRANISGRHVKQKTAALYAKNPRIVARRRETLDFEVWDENPSSLLLAYETVQAGIAAVQQASVETEIMARAAAGHMAPGAAPGMAPGMPPAPPAPPQMPPGFEQAQAVIADFTQGMQRRQQVDKIGKTLEIMFNYYAREQKPLDLKRGMKTTVRRATTTGVGYVELAFQRQYGPSPSVTERLADARARLDHLKTLAEELGEGELDDSGPERAELELSMQSLLQESEIILREGLVFDFPQSTRVIPDKRTKALDGFIGAGHLTIEYAYTVEEVQEQFGVDLKAGDYTSYTANPGSTREFSSNDVMDDDYQWSPPSDKKSGMVCVWKMYDKPSGLVYYLADGYCGFLRPPAAPDVFVEDFWPVYALTFNAVESEEELFPPSDVSLMLDMQKEYNRSRQGKREHRDAARPRWVYSNGAFGSEEDELNIRDMKPFEALGINIDPQTDIRKVLQTLPVPGVDPNLYETGEVFTDTQLVVGSQEATFGGVSKATATESAIAANSTTASDASSIDDLDAFLSLVARAAGQILMRECSTEKVKEIAGVGAAWPQMSLEDIAKELYLEIEVGSTGKPNQAVEINNWKQMLPLLLQMPNIDPTWLAKQTIRRLDDRLDLTEAVAAGIPSIASMNIQKGGTLSNPAAEMQGGAHAPGQQGPQGAQNATKPPGQSGSGPAFGSNQVASPV